jgi:hypothetical protein
VSAPPKPPAPKTFKHSGDLGDIIFALPTIRALGGGILYLDPTGGRSEPIIQSLIRKQQTRLNSASIQSLATLLVHQPYIREIRLWSGESVDVNLNEFRQHMTYRNIADSHLAIADLPSSERNTAWLTVPEPIAIPQFPIIISRTVRYAPNYSWWYGYFQEIKGQCAFVGHAKEHEIFEYTIEDKVPYIQTPDILTLARVIAGCAVFVGNASLPHAIAEGLKKRVIVELCRIAPNIVFTRADAQYV